MKHVARLAAILVVVILTAVSGPGAAQAIIPDTPPPQGTPCDPDDWPPDDTERRFTWITSAQVDPVLTQFLALNVAPGTSGTRTDTLTRVNSVTVTFGTSTEITTEASVILGKVATKVGFSVLTARASTDTVTNTMTWTFSQPGYYGLYKGTRRVVGTSHTMRCRFTPISNNYSWSQRPWEPQPTRPTRTWRKEPSPATYRPLPDRYANWPNYTSAADNQSHMCPGEVA